MAIPFLELKPAYLELKDQFDEAYHRVMDSGWYLLGQETEAFEEEYACFCGVQHCITVANGLDALILSLRAYGIGPGDEVIVPSHTFIATWLAITQVGAIPVAVEPDPTTYNINPANVESAITQKTKAIIPVHLYGQPADMDLIMSIAEREDLIVIEDAAQSQGAFYKNRRSGSLGHAASHSFYPGKNLGAFSDGGAVTTNDASLAIRIKKLRNYGCQIKYDHELLGVNSRIDELQAAFLRIKLRHLDAWNDRRTKLADLYRNTLKEPSELVLPKVPAFAKSAWHLFVVQHPDRVGLQRHLRDSDIGTLIHYPVPPYLNGAYQHLNIHAGAFPHTEKLANRILSLPISPHHNEEEINTVCEAIKRFVS
ncbi:MAG: DegT/DnrJ/EryC1/StrS family aminotransferase [Pirellulaceae bacterium]|nr:DegT/DnrJ/EryC1/StrS family aminotransferase [Pirellulaceae bacterium]